MGRKKKKRKRPDEHDPRLPIENGRPFIDVCGLGAQVVIGALKVTKALLFTVIPLLGFPKYRYLQ